MVYDNTVMETGGLGTRPSRPRRAYHSKGKTGCITCKIRKVRCDEGQPACNRCVSTGRKCDGYVAPSPSDSAIMTTAPLDIAADLKLPISRNSNEEIRSYRYFLDITAPSLAGFFYAEFWLNEIPRACLNDAAIWHAVTSLGAAHELASTVLAGRESQKLFALQQFNSSIRCLTASSYHADKWRALVVSTIFTCVCTIQGLHEQARMHLAAGGNILREIQRESTLQRRSPKATSALVLRAKPMPVSIPAIQSILSSFQIQVKAMDNGGIADNVALLSQDQSFTAWRFYTAPLSYPLLTTENIGRANRAAESLMSGMVLFSQEHVKELGDVYTGKNAVNQLAKLVKRQGPHVRCFKELARVAQAFDSELASSGSTTISAKALLPLRLFHATNKLLLIDNPEEPDAVRRYKALPELCSSILDIAETIMDLGNEKVPGVSSPPVTPSLFLVAHSGFSQSVRRRAVDLLRRPRLEGLWDSLISASLADAIMVREREAAQEHAQKVGGIVSENGEDASLLFRIFNITVSFTGDRGAIVVLRTWRERMDGAPGKSTAIYW